jgi:hypothetical protein
MEEIDQLDNYEENDILEMIKEKDISDMLKGNDILEMLEEKDILLMIDILKGRGIPVFDYLDVLTIFNIITNTYNETIDVSYNELDLYIFKCLIFLLIVKNKKKKEQIN